MVHLHSKQAPFQILSRVHGSLWPRFDPCNYLFLQKPTQDISLLGIFQLSHIVLHSYQSVERVCVCVSVCLCACIFCIAMHETLLISFFIYNIFHLDVHYVRMLVQRFELQGSGFTNFRYYYNTIWWKIGFQFFWLNTCADPVPVFVNTPCTEVMLKDLCPPFAKQQVAWNHNVSFFKYSITSKIVRPLIVAALT